MDWIQMDYGYAVMSVEGRSGQHLRSREFEMALVVVFAVLAIVLHIFQYPFPPAPWLKFDLAGVPIVILSLLSVKAGLASIPIFWLGALILTTDPTRIIGPSMKTLAELTTAIPLAIMYTKLSAKRLKEAKVYAIAFVTALLCRVLSMLLLNYLIAPHWLVWARWMATFEAAYEFVIKVHLPYNAIFNAIVVCYVVPTSMAVWKILKKYIF